MKKVFTFIHNNPDYLEKEIDDNITNDVKGQGSGNKASKQELNFIELLRRFEVNFKYQPNGFQRTPDFWIYTDKDIISIDLKHTNTTKIFLNDGWFDKETIYVISFKEKKSRKTLVSLGSEIPTKKETDIINDLLVMKKKLNTEYKNADSLSIVFRFANQYSCKKFNDEFIEKMLIKVLELKII